MNCRDCKTKIPAYLAGNLLAGEFALLEDHLDHCPSCRAQAAALFELDSLISLADIEIPEIDLTAAIIAEVKSSQLPIGIAQLTQPADPAGNYKRIGSLLQDLLTAAAAAIIIFWFSGPVFAQHQIPLESGKVVQLSNSVGGVFQTYLGFYDSAAEKLSRSISQINQGLKKGVK